MTTRGVRASPAAGATAATRQATVIVNALAGGYREQEVDQLVGALAAVGFDVEARPTRDMDDLDRALDETRGLVVAVGGDGTMRAVGLRLRGSGRPIALLPRGTANNVGTALGLDDSRDAAAFGRGLATPRRHTFDLGRVSGPWGEAYFLEAFSLGLYAELLVDYAPENGKSPLRAVEAIQEVLAGYEPVRLGIRDGDALHEGSYLLAAAMNTPRLGTRLPLAPGADPCDGRLELVLVRYSPERSLLDYGGRLVQGTFDEAEGVIRIPVERFEVRRSGAAFHVDDEVHASGAALEGSLRVEVLPGALEVWTPGRTE